MSKTSKPPVKPPHPSRLNALDLALLNGANARLEAAKLELKCKLLEAKIRELEYVDAARIIRDNAHALQVNQVFAERQYRELAERLSKDYAVNFKTCAIMPETGEITTHTSEA